jgi:hypothetical protein
MILYGVYYEECSWENDYKKSILGIATSEDEQEKIYQQARKKL